MKNWNCKISSNQRRLPPALRISELIAVATLVIVGLLGAGAIGSAAAGKPDSPIVAKCKADLAKRLKLQTNSISLIEARPTNWPDAALGMPEPGKMYAQVITPGLLVTLEAKSTRYVYTTSTKTIRYGGPASIWSLSMLYTEPVQNEPNLNGDLYQCSLLGTNCVRLVSGVSEFFPQEKGALVIKRRTSRSGHELLYLNAGQATKPRTLYGAFDFGAAAVNSKQDKWAAFVRPTLGATWNVVVARIGLGTTKAQILPLPDGVRPGQIAWSAEKLMILTTNGERTICYAISPSAAKPEWKAIGVHEFPGLPDYMLNKSETLEISEVTVDGRPGVEVARVWFTGDRNVKARIDGVTLRGYDFLAGRYAFVWGEKNSTPVAYTVDISTGEVIPASTGIGGDIKPFAYPPRNTPLGSAKR
jgi:hypothetical protein